MTYSRLNLLLGFCLILTSTTSASADGTVGRQRFHTPALGVEKAYRIYLPENYAAKDQRYPVIYLLHGLGVGEDAWVDSVNLAGAADRLKLQAIVVMPDGDRGYYVDAVAPVDMNACLGNTQPRRNKNEARANLCVRTANYETYITRDLIRHVDRNYRTIAKREVRAIAGESGGGFGAIMLALRHRDLFSSAASHSGFFSLLHQIPRNYDRSRVFPRRNFNRHPNKELLRILGGDVANWRAHDPITLVETLKNGELSLYFDVGIQDQAGFYPHALFFHDRVDELGIAHRFEAVPGRHHEDLWRQRIKHSLEFHADHFRRTGVYPAP